MAELGPVPVPQRKIDPNDPTTWGDSGALEQAGLADLAHKRAAEHLGRISEAAKAIQSAPDAQNGRAGVIIDRAIKSGALNGVAPSQEQVQDRAKSAVDAVKAYMETLGKK